MYIGGSRVDLRGAGSKAGSRAGSRRASLEGDSAQAASSAKNSLTLPVPMGLPIPRDDFSPVGTELQPMGGGGAASGKKETVVSVSPLAVDDSSNV